MRKVSLVLGIALLAAALNLISSAPASANTVVNGIDLVKATTLGPGVVWWGVRDGKDEQCSLGIPVHRGTVNIALSAGHCAGRGSSVITDLAGRGGEVAGTAIDSVAAPNAGQAVVEAGADYSLLQIDDSVPLSSAVPGMDEFTSVLTADDLEQSYPDLCVLGSTTGLTCGQFVRLLPSRNAVQFRAAVDDGDSGGTVFAVTKEGQVAAVGTLIGSMHSDPSLAVAQLVAPVLQEQGLSLGFV